MKSLIVVRDLTDGQSATVRASTSANFDLFLMLPESGVNLQLQNRTAEEIMTALLTYFTKRSGATA